MDTKDVKVCLLKRYASPRGNFGAGSVLSVSEAEAEGLELAGAAERVSVMPAYVPGAQRETATDKGAEKRAKREAEAKAKAEAEAKAQAVDS